MSWADLYDCVVLFGVVGLVAALGANLIYGRDDMRAWWEARKMLASERRFLANLTYACCVPVPGYEPAGTVQNPADPSPRPRRSEDSR